MATYYKPSGKSSTIGIPLLIIGGLITAAVLGAIYGYATFNIPLVYISFLLTFAFAFAMGWVVNQITKIGKIRNSSIVNWGGLFLGVAALFFAWVFWLNVALGILSFNPANVLSSQKLLGQIGVWSMGSFSPTGWTLYAFWGVEAAIIVIGTWMFSGGQVNEPFCEPCDKWLNTKKEISNLSIPLNPKELITSLESGQIDELVQLTKSDSGAFTRVSLKDCPSCEVTTLMDLSIVQIKVDDNGKAEEAVSPLMQNFVLSPENFAKLNDHVWAEQVIKDKDTTE